MVHGTISTLDMCAGAAGGGWAGRGGGVEPLQDGGGHQGPAAAGGQSELNIKIVTKYTVIITDYILLSAKQTCKS